MIVLVAVGEKARVSFYKNRKTNPRSLLWFLSGAAAATAAIVLPIVLRGAWPNMVQAVGRLAAHDMLSGNALNAWWMVTWVVRAMYALDLGWVQAFTSPSGSSAAAGSWKSGIRTRS